jgi:hypothetical protein
LIEFVLLVISEVSSHLTPYFYLKDHIDMKGEQLENKTDWWSRLSPKGSENFTN